MEKFLKYFTSFIVIFSFCLIVYASQDEVDKARETMDKYCQEDTKNIKGCVYDPNDPLYTQSGLIANCGSDVCLSPPNISLTRGYVTANANGEMIFAGCYKGHINNSENSESRQLNLIKSGDFYVFKIIALINGVCQKVADDIIIAKGTKYKIKNSFDGEFDGKSSLGTHMASYIGWTAENGGECPKGFGLIANTRWYTSADHRYVFSNDGIGFNTGVKSYWGHEDYVTTPGCTVEDETGKKEAEACFNDAVTKINNTSCPSDYSELSKLASTLKDYQNDCESEFNILYAKGLLESDAKEMKDKLVNAVQSKLSSCQDNQCKVTSSQQQKIKNNLKKNENKLCKSGKCPVGNYNEQSNNKNAKCYRIGNGSTAYFEWTESPSGQPASLENGISKSECYGTYETRNCIDCLKKVYKASGLNNTQINCMLDIEREKSSIDDQIKKEIEEQFDKKIEEKLKESEEIRNQAYNQYAPPNFDDPLDVNNCEQILGENLTKLLKAAITILQVVGAIIAIVKGMMTLIPPILAKDADALKKASKTLITIAIILLVIFLFRPLLQFLGILVGFDTSCIA